MENLSDVFNIDILKKAWLGVRSKNKTGGIDGISLNDFEIRYEINLQSLLLELKQKKYIPEPYLRVFIRKEKGGRRELALPAIKDKIVQKAVQLIYQDEIEKKMMPNCYAYRKSLGHRAAINKICNFRDKGYTFVSQVDIDNFFDNIERELLLEKCRLFYNNDYILRLIEMWVKTGIFYRTDYIQRNRGIAQGSVLSPALSNIYLIDFDRKLIKKKIINIRYADNIIVFGKNQEEAGSKALCAIDLLRDLCHLKINTRQKEIENFNEGFIFCGIEFRDTSNRIAPEKFNKIINTLDTYKTISELIVRTTAVNAFMSSVRYYYSEFGSSDQLIEISAKAEAMVKGNNSIRVETISDANPKKQKLQHTNDINRAILKKKKKYQKLFLVDADFAVISDYSSLSKNGDELIVKRGGKITYRVDTDKIRNLVITAKSSSVSTEAIKMCADKNISISFADGFGNPFAFLMNKKAPIFKTSIMQSEAAVNSKGKFIAEAITRSKIKNQAAILKYFLKNDSTSEFVPEIREQVRFIEQELQKQKFEKSEGSITDFLNHLLGIEGICGAAYWKCFSGLISAHFKFEKREKQGAKDVVNMMLNYGYGILYNRIFRAVIFNGLNPYISYLHREQKDKPTLVYDLIEQFRAPVVDRVVIALLRLGFKPKTEGNLLCFETKKTITEKFLSRINAHFIYNKKEVNIDKLIIQKTRELRDFILNLTPVFKPFIQKW